MTIGNMFQLLKSHHLAANLVKIQKYKILRFA